MVQNKRVIISVVSREVSQKPEKVYFSRVLEMQDVDYPLESISETLDYLYRDLPHDILIRIYYHE